MTRLLLVSPLFTTCTWHRVLTFHCTTLNMNSYRTAWLNSSQTCVSKPMFAILTFWNFVYKVVCLSLSLSYRLTTQFSRFWCTRRGWCSPWFTSSLGLAELSGEMFYISGSSKFKTLQRSKLLCVIVSIKAPSIITFFSDSNSSVTWLVIRCLII